MKKFRFLAVMALLMIFGCSKDDFIDTERDSMVIDENNKSVVNGERNSGIYLYSYLDVNPNTASEVLDVYSDGLKILENGLLSGSVKGFGPINKENSYIKFIPIGDKKFCDNNDLNSCYKYIVQTEGIIILKQGEEINFSMNTSIWNNVQSDGSVYIEVNGSGVLNGLNLTGTVEWRGHLYFNEYGILSDRYRSTPILQLKYRKL